MRENDPVITQVAHKELGGRCPCRKRRSLVFIPPMGFARKSPLCMHRSGRTSAVRGTGLRDLSGLRSLPKPAPPGNANFARSVSRRSPPTHWMAYTVHRPIWTQPVWTLFTAL